MAENSRELILDTLLEMEKSREYGSRLIKAVLDKYNYLSAQDKAFMKRVLEGTVERQLELDYYLNHFSSVPVKKMKPLIRNLLRMSVYQLLFMDAIPDSAVCNEACKLAQKRKFGSLKGFVNGVLRSIAKAKEALPLPDAQKEKEQYLSIKYSMPLWLVEKWLKSYGEELTQRILDGLLQIHPVSLRFSTRLSQEQIAQYVQQLKERGVSLSQSKYLPYVYMAENTENIRMLPGFEEGAFTVQDVSSVLAVEAAGISAQDFVMDICAAPGGKTMLAAEKAARVLSRDVSPDKLDYIEENLTRMGLQNVETQEFDATCRDDKYKEQADVVIMDVPCSGLGIIGKKRDIKYNVSEEGLASLNELQKSIVSSSWEYVKPGGILLYSTCTINPAENQEMVEWIVENFPFEPVDLTGRIPESLRQDDLQAQSLQSRGRTLTLRRYGIQIFPGIMEADGFFFAVLRRV